MSPTHKGGVIIGRFMPPHAGHLYLYRFARAFAGDLTIFVCTLAGEPIPGELRHAWVRELAPGANVVHITEEIPQAARSEEGAYRIWADTIRRHLAEDPEYVFASEAYGADLAHALGAVFIPVDPNRSLFPISAGMIRDDPFAHWELIPEVVRRFFVAKVSVDDPLLAQELATVFATVATTDYRAYARQMTPRPAGPGDLAARAQFALEAALAVRADRVLFTCPDASLEAVGQVGRELESVARGIGFRLYPQLALVTREDGQPVRATHPEGETEIVSLKGGDRLGPAVGAVERVFGIHPRAVG